MTPLSTLLNEAFSNSPEKYQKIGFREAHRIKTTKVFSPNEHVGYQVDAFVHGAYSAEKRLRPLFDAMKKLIFAGEDELAKAQANLRKTAEDCCDKSN